MGMEDAPILDADLEKRIRSEGWGKQLDIVVAVLHEMETGECFSFDKGGCGPGPPTRSPTTIEWESYLLDWPEFWVRYLEWPAFNELLMFPLQYRIQESGLPQSGDLTLSSVTLGPGSKVPSVCYHHARHDLRISVLLSMPEDFLINYHKRDDHSHRFHFTYQPTVRRIPGNTP